MIREKKPPTGPRREYSPAKGQENPPQGLRPRAESTRDPNLLHASSHNNHSLFSFGASDTADDNTSGTYDFLPSPSFDDLASSIASASNGFQFDSKAPTRTITSPEKRSLDAMESADGRAPVVGRGTNGTRPTRTNSLLRRQSTSTRQSSISSTLSGASGTMDPSTGLAAARNRRQSQYPPVSGSATANATRAPRKSIGPGIIDTDYIRPTQKRRPSLASSTGGLSDAGGVSARLNVGVAPTYTDGARGLTASRAAKTKSLQPPSRQGQTHLSVNTSTPDHIRSASFATRSPAKLNGRGTTTPSSAKRISMMPGSGSSHATGLGARTVSPTDARRAKRLSVMHAAPPMPNTPPTSQAEGTMRRSSRSPSMLPRKVPTPSSSRTTPDINRKSYSSGLSITSSASYNTSRTSTGSLQPRLPQFPPPNSSSRLPTPKPRNVHSSAGNDEEQEVPPVPAIPKAYESPKESPAEPPFFGHRKSSLPFDASSINSASTNSLSGRGSIRDPIKNEKEPRPRVYIPTGQTAEVMQQNPTAPIKKKNLQPLRLPPLNLLPLSTPTTTKIASLDEPALSDGQITPPPRRAMNKTPSTPMTASKASFFSRHRPESKSEQAKNLRSSTSVHHLRAESISQLGGSSSESSKAIPINNPPPRQAVSPYISSSLPKNNGELSFLPRSKTSGDFANFEPAEPNRPPRLTGPRAQNFAKTAKTETPTASSPEDPGTPVSSTSLRRKLSLGWKRSTSKSNIHASHAANERGSEYAPPPPKHDNMPPPRLPASATMNNLTSYGVSSPSPSVKSTTYLDSKRRKSSTSSLSMFGSHDRTRSDSWGINGSPKKEKAVDTRTDRTAPASTRSASSVMNRVLGNKHSSSTMRSPNPWTVDLDRDDLIADEEMRKFGSKRKETEQAAKVLDALRKRATPKERVNPHQAIQMASLNIFERGEIIDFKEIYFCGTTNAEKHVGELSSDKANFGYDDDRGDYHIAFGDHISYRYEIIDLLGKGSFGQVVRCIDHKTGGLVAIKIIRNKKRFHQQALVEVNILQKLREWDPKNKHSMVNFTQSFYFRGHLCISTELLDMNLYELIKNNSFRGFSLKVVRRFTKQLLSSLLLLKQHKVIHCDLKPENILLAHPLHSEIKVIDFGSSCFENEKVYTYIQSRFYRSPEVILGMTYGMPIDMWSVGCILAELFTGVPIFPGENEQEQLACIMEVFGPPEKHLIEKSSRKKLFFDSMGKPRLTVSSKGRRRRPSSKSLQGVLKSDDEAFNDFIARCLRWDPDRRLKPEEAVRHEFITGIKPSKVMPPPRVTSRNESPRRTNTTTAPPTSNRPLPEPPATSFRNNMAVRSREVTTTSPTKAPAGARRQSTVNGANTSIMGATGPGPGPGPGPPATIVNRRVSTTGANLAASGNSSLPRVTRSVSGRVDLATVGATVAMNGKR